MPTAADTAQALFEARATKTPIAALTDARPDMTVAEAYEIQRELVGRITQSEGGDVVGYKLGLTSKPMQEMLGVHEPDYGPVLSSMVFDDGVTVDLDDYIQPKVEAEILLVLSKPLRGPGVTTADVANAVAGAVAAIEMVDSRIADWKIKLTDTIADLASSAAAVKGSRLVPVDFDIKLTGMVITRNGETVATGAGAAALGNPMFAVAWLANALAEFGVTLEPGQIVMTGALHAAFSVAPGDIVTAEFDRLGSVTMRFAGGS
ncbi:MAG: fumarylacetoacetate hydrolase family protein [Actinomycetota bacterium]|nr:fumarylacetoacetate hydrolase family protein [Actinomycetota bacterium]